MPESDGIIHSFQQRRQLEEDLAALAATTSQAALTQGAQRLVERYSTDVLLSAVVRHLGTTSRLRRSRAVVRAACRWTAVEFEQWPPISKTRRTGDIALILDRYWSNLSLRH
jgi:hypothetical protein